MNKFVVLLIAVFAAVIGWADIRAITPVPRQGSGSEWWTARHQQKLEEIKVASTNGGVEVVFLGDSITHFWETSAKQHWAKAFGKHSNFKSLNLGYSGDRTEHLLWRIENGELDGYEAKVAVLMIGTNNHEPPMNVICGIKSVLNAIVKKQRGIRILLCAIFPRGKDDNDYLRKNNNLVNREIKKFCDGRKIVWCDFGEMMLAADGRLSAEVMPDYLHPSIEGYEIWASAITPYVRDMVQNYGKAYTFGSRCATRWTRPVVDGPSETLPLSRVQATNDRWPGVYGSYWWLSRVAQGRDVIAKSNGSMDLVMLGDSITHFWQQKHPQHWEKFVGERKIANFGCGGDKVQNVLWMIENGALDGAQVKYVSVLIGTNDNSSDSANPERVAAGIVKAVKMIREKQPQAKVILHAIFPRGSSAKDTKHIAARNRNEKTNALVKKMIANEANVIWVDIGAKFLGPDGFVPKEMMADRIHPTEAGYDIWADTLNRVMKGEVIK